MVIVFEISLNHGIIKMWQKFIDSTSFDTVSNLGIVLSFINCGSGNE